MIGGEKTPGGGQNFIDIQYMYPNLPKPQENINIKSIYNLTLKNLNK